MVSKQAYMYIQIFGQSFFFLGNTKEVYAHNLKKYVQKMCGAQNAVVGNQLSNHFNY